MSNKSLVSIYGASSPFSTVIDSLARGDAQYEGLKTYFGRYRNPIGIEVEVENCPKPIEWPQKSPIFWKTAEDGSLRNHGIEFISVALSGRMIDHAIKELSEVLAKKKPSWSVRTSIHVHVNMSTLTFNQLKAFCMIYALYEDCFFSMCDPSRKGNSFCYPVSQLDPKDFSQIADTNKYCALNLAPLRRQTTVEFRHLQGTDDWRHVRRWIQMIVKLHYYVEKMESQTSVNDIKAVINNGEYVVLFNNIFGATTQLFSSQQIQESGKNHAAWALVLSEWRFV